MRRYLRLSSQCGFKRQTSTAQGDGREKFMLTLSRKDSIRLSRALGS